MKKITSIKSLKNWVIRNKFNIEDEWTNEKYFVVNADILIEKIKQLLSTPPQKEK